MEERELVLSASCGDDKAFVKLYEMYYQKLYKYALFTLRTKEDAEDAVSSTITDVYAGIGRIREPEKFGSWIFQILSNKCRHKMRDYYKESENVVSTEDEDTDIIQLVASDDNIEEQVMVKEVLMLLSENEREIINLSVFAGYKSEEIGEILHMNASTVRSTLKRTLAKLAKIIR